MDSAGASLAGKRVTGAQAISFLELKQRWADAGQESEVVPADGDGDGGSGSAPCSARPPQHSGVQQPHSPPQQQQQQSALSRNAPRRANWHQLTGHSRNSWRSSSHNSLDQAVTARPLLKYGGKQHQLLQRRCRKAMGTMERLQQPVFSLHHGGLKAPLPKAALRFCKGLAFVMQRKAGVMAGWNWGHGFVIRRQPDGSWSAPCFLRLRYGSFGFTLGMQSIQSCHVLQTEEQVRAFATDHGSITFDATMTLDVDPYELGAPTKPLRHKDARMPENSQAPRSAMLSDGLIWDLSVRGGFTLVDDALNCQLYGNDVSADEILGGRTAVPAEFVPLYNAVDALAAEAQVVRQTVSKFQLARSQSLRRASAAAAASSSSSSLLQRVRTLSRNSSIPRCESPPPAEGVWPGRSSSTQAGGSGGDSSMSASLFGGSPQGAFGLGLTPSSDFKLFGDVGVPFEEQNTYEQQEAEGAGQQQQQGSRGEEEPPQQGQQQQQGEQQQGQQQHGSQDEPQQQQGQQQEGKEERPQQHQGEEERPQQQQDHEETSLQQQAQQQQQVQEELERGHLSAAVLTAAAVTLPTECFDTFNGAALLVPPSSVPGGGRSSPAISRTVVTAFA